MNKKVIMHIDADAFFASVEEGFNPLLRNKPVIVGGFADERGCVHTANYHARRFGVYTGMPLRKAQEICSNAVFLKGDYRQYKSAGMVIEGILKGITPYVEMSSLDDSYIDVTGFERFYSSPVEIALKIKKEVWIALKITVSIGISTSKLVARIASGINKPDGLTIVPEGKEKEFLSRRPVKEIPGVGKKIEMIFNSFGIKTVGELANLPKSFIMQVVGSANGQKIWEFANGIDDRPVKCKEMSKQISRETSFIEDTDNENFILAMLNYLSERIGKKLRDEKWFCRKVALKIRYSDNRVVNVSTFIKSHTDDGKKIFSIVKNLYKRVNNKKKRICFVAVIAGEIDYRERQKFICPGKIKQEQVNTGVDRVRNFFGFTSVIPARALLLSEKYRIRKYGYILRTPSLSQ
ncbi:DNA polymerase IV [candidate division KSB1 bacterium]|nr:MAG: DNA polymerase IV [candidate division KSB1 bacterium]